MRNATFLTLLAGLSMLLFSDPDRRERPVMFALEAWVTVANAYMVCPNFWRYEYGIVNAFPHQVTNNAYGHAHTATVYSIVLWV
jgi:hypothetical protein